MTEPAVVLQFDQALDGQLVAGPDGAEPLIAAARTVQTLFDHQRAAASEEFLMQLEAQLFPNIVIPSAADGSPPVAVSHPQPMPRPARLAPDLDRISRSRLAAIAAVLVLLFGGMGAILGGPLDPRSTPEPSSIPAASFGTAEASPGSVGKTWTVPPPQGVQGSSGPAFIEDGLMYSILNGPAGPYAQVVDLETGQALWSSRLAVSADLTAAVWNGLLLFTGTGGRNYELFAFDGHTGKERWSIPFAQRPVNLVVDRDRAFLLGSGNLVVAIDLETQQELWQTDLGSFDPDWEAYGGMNRYGYFNDGRLALTNGVLAVLISNGQLIALDAEDGSSSWTRAQENDGRTTVQVVAGRFVVTAEGKSIFDMGDDPYSMPPSPVPAFDPETQPCERTVEPQRATDTTALGDYETSATSFDPATGDPSWKVRVHSAVWLYLADDARLVAIIRPGWDSAIGNDDFSIYCAIDGATGEVARTSGVEFVHAVVTDPETGAPLGLGGTESGLPIWVPDIDMDSAKLLPRFDPDIENFSGARWVQRADGLLLITEQNGTIAGIPMDGQRWTPPVETPQSSWAIEPPAGTNSSDRPPVIVEGLILRTFNRGSGSLIQSVDTRTGKIQWEQFVRAGSDVVAAAEDLLLVAGRSNLNAEIPFELIALDGRTGEERWSQELTQRPVGLLVADGRVYTFGNGDLLQAFDLHTQHQLWQVDLSQFGDATTDGSSGANAYGDLAGDRLSAIDGTIGAIVSNGRLVAIDASDGSVKWADDRSTEGWTRVSVVDGRFVVTAFGGETLMYDPEATPLPITPTDPTAAPCTQVIAPRSSSDPVAASGVGETVDSFDPQTGESPWGLSLSEQYFVWPVDKDRLVAQVEPIQSAGIADNGEWSPCLIDGATGAVSETTGEELVTFVVSGTKAGTYWGLGVLPSGVTFLVDDVDPAVASSLPLVDLGKDFSGFRWVQESDDLILITAQDGTLIGLPAKAPDRGVIEATPTMTTPAADTGWIAKAPDGIADYAEGGMDHAIAGGRIFRAFTMETGRPHVQAVDASTGDVLWDVEIEFGGDLMEAAGDLLLVNEGSYTLVAQVAALDAATGQVVWTAPLSDYPVAMTMARNRLLVLGTSDKLDAIDLATGQTVYSVDIHGDAQNPVPSTFRDLTEQRHRMAFDGETLYATLADGSVVAVDLETGAAKWWSLRPTPGQVDVYVIDGAVVTIDMGDQDAIVAHFEAMRDAALSGTPSAIATPVLDSTLPSCTQPSEVATPEATPGADAAPGPVTTTYRGLDANTGEVRWSTVLPEQSGGPVPVDDGVLYFVFAAGNGSTTISQLAYCFVDASTGQGREVNPVDKISGQVLILERPDWPGEDRALIAGEGLPILSIPSEYTADITAPVVVLDETFSDGWWWNEVYGDSIYISLNDGDLVKIPIPAE